MKAQFFIISSVIIIYVIMLSFQYISSFSDIKVSSIEEQQEFSYIQKIKDNFVQAYNTSYYTNNGSLKLIVEDIDFTRKFLNGELLKRGIDFESRFMFFSNGFEEGDLSMWTNFYGTPEINNQVVYNGNYSIYFNDLESVSKVLSGVSEVYAKVYVNFKTLPQNNRMHYFLGFYDHGNQILGLGVWKISGRQFRLRAYSLIGSGDYWYSDINIKENEWHYFELYWYENGTNSNIKAWYDGDLKIDNKTFDSQGNGETVDDYRVGVVDAVGGGNSDLYVDCVAIGSDYIGKKCYSDGQPYFVFNLKTDEMKTETDFPFIPFVISYAPKYWFNFVNNTIAGKPTLFSLYWTDDIGLSGYIFSTSNTGKWVNDTWISFENKIFSEDFESGTFGNWSGTYQCFHGNVSIVSNEKHQGLNSTEIMIDTIGCCHQAYAWEDLPFTYNTLYTSLYFKWKTGGPVNGNTHGVPLFLLSEASSNVISTFVYNDSGTYKWAVQRNNSGVLGTKISSTIVDIDTWYKVKLKYTATGYVLYINDQNILQENGLNLGNGVSELTIGDRSSEAIFKYYLDDIVVANETTSSTAWSNVTKTLNSTVGANVQWCVYANDTSNNWNSTSCDSPFSFTTT